LVTSVSDVSSLLHEDEALVLIDLGKGKGEGYVWVVDRSGAVNTIDAKFEDLTTKIAAPRASFEPSTRLPMVLSMWLSSRCERLGLLEA
jgi:hypothetical protein